MDLVSRLLRFVIDAKMSELRDILALVNRTVLDGYGFGIDEDVLVQFLFTTNILFFMVLLGLVRTRTALFACLVHALTTGMAQQTLERVTQSSDIYRRVLSWIRNEDDL